MEIKSTKKDTTRSGMYAEGVRDLYDALSSDFDGFCKLARELPIDYGDGHDEYDDFIFQKVRKLLRI